MTRLIDADELNEYIGRESLDTREKIFALVDRMPTLPNPCGKPCAFERPYGKWIPFSERLPEEGKLVLVTLNPISLKDAEHPVIITKYTTEKDSWIHTIPDAVLAWMPLPEPYKGGEK